MITLAIVEDDTEIRDGIVSFLGVQEDILCEIAAGSVEEFFEKVERVLPPEVVILDIGLPGISGIQAIRFIKDKLPQSDIIMFTVHDDPNKIFQALVAGATGYLLKNTPLVKIKEAIEQARAGGSPMSPRVARKVIDHFHQEKSTARESPLTDREKEIVSAMVDGLSYKLIGDRLGISIDTVRHHVKNIYRKLHVTGKAEVITMSLRGEI